MQMKGKVMVYKSKATNNQINQANREINFITNYTSIIQYVLMHTTSIVNNNNHNWFDRILNITYPNCTAYIVDTVDGNCV